MTLAAKLALILTGLCRALLAGCVTNQALQPIAPRIWTCLLAAATGFQILFLSWRNGRLPAARKRLRKAGARAKPLTAPKLSLPRGFAWLVKLLPEAAVYGSQLQHLLTDPQVATFLAASPQAGNTLRPICRMLGVKPIPQMRRAQAPKPATPERETTPPETTASKTPPPEPPTATMTPKLTAEEKESWVAENIKLVLPRSVSEDREDLRRIRPFTGCWRLIEPCRFRCEIVMKTQPL